MNLRKRIAAMEEAAGPLDFPDGPISLTEAVSGKRDVQERRRLGRAGVHEAVQVMRELFERLARKGDDDFPDGPACGVSVLN